MAEYRRAPSFPIGSQPGAMSAVERYAAAKVGVERFSPTHQFDISGKSGDFSEPRRVTDDIYEVKVPYWLLRQTAAEALRIRLMPREEAYRISTLDSTFRALGYHNYLDEVCQLVGVVGRTRQLGIVQELGEWSYIFGDDFSPYQRLPDNFVRTRDLEALNTQINQAAEDLYKKLQRDGISLGVEYLKVGVRHNPLKNAWEKKIFIDIVGTEHGKLLLATHTQGTSRMLPSIDPQGTFWDMIDAAAPL